MIQTFKIEVTAQYPMFRDMQNQAAMAYGVQAIPWSVLIDRKGMVRYSGVNLPTAAMLKWVM